jgi:mannose-6-phosphate isomerase-like protein (cupin superfamily)
MSSPVSKQESLNHYYWGQDCEGWNFVAGKALSVKQERMPAGSAEQLHFHENAQQFFFILKGKAGFEIDGALVEISEGEGIHIAPGQKHRIVNSTNAELEFILCSQPSTVNDRINCYEP